MASLALFTLTHIYASDTKGCKKTYCISIRFHLGLRCRDLKASFIQLSDRLHDFYEERGQVTLIS